jgi:hypothetical protein
MEKGRRPTVLNTCLKRSLFVIHLSVKRGPGFSVPANRASTIIAWMEDLEDTNGEDHPCFFFFFFEDPKPSITEKVARVLAESKKRHVSLF